MSTFYTPPGYTGQAELTASTGLVVTDQGLWRFSQSGYNDGATFGLSLTFPSPQDGGNLDKQKPASAGFLMSMCLLNFEPTQVL